MSGLTYDQQMDWRTRLENIIEGMVYDLPTFIHPPIYYNYEENLHKTEREIMEWEISQVLDSDIVVVNLDGLNDSIGSHMELGAVVGAKMAAGKDIKIVTLGEINESLHPWLTQYQLRNETNIEELAEYIVSYLLI